MNNLKEQLDLVKDRVRLQKRKIKEPSPSPARWKQDGEDHINIWDHAETKLGKFLPHSVDFGINHPIFGKFCTVESFWKYVQSEERDDRIRVMSGKYLRSFSKKLTMRRVPNFRAVIMDANYIKLKQNVKYLQELSNSTLPLDCYYINNSNGVRTRPTFFKWLLAGYEEIRLALQEGREPDFEFLIDIPGSEIYDYVDTDLTLRTLLAEQA